MPSVTLTCHAETRSDAVRSIDVRVCRMEGGKLTVTYILAGDLDRVRIPTPQPLRIADRLWEHTCCEIFIRCEDLPAYHEFNFAPSGEWAAYAFVRYREGAPLIDEALHPHVTVRSAGGKLELDAVIRLDRLSPMHAHARLSLALSAVVEDSDGRLSYWALAHRPGKPDFHHPGAFAVVIPAELALECRSPGAGIQET
jgi:hypothetical protein